MDIEVRPRGFAKVIDLSGEDAGAGSALLRKRLTRLLESGESLFILNLIDGPVLDSAFLGELVADRERIRKHQGVIKLVVSSRQRELIVASKLDYLFELFPDEEEALDSFAAWNTTAGIP